MAAIPALCHAETVAIFAPNLDFKDGAERNAYVTKIAKSLSDATGANWTAQAFARAADFESARSNIDVVILDADYYSSKGGSLKPRHALRKRTNFALLQSHHSPRREL